MAVSTEPQKPSEIKPEGEDFVTAEFRKLDVTRVTLARLGRVIVILLFFDLFATVWLYSQHVVIESQRTVESRNALPGEEKTADSDPVASGRRLFWAFVGTVLSSLVGVSALAAWEKIRARGDATFVKISDELEWRHVRKKPAYTYGDFSGREYRLILRDFVRAMNLPLVKGEYGPGVIALLFTACLMFQLYLGLTSPFLFS